MAFQNTAKEIEIRIHSFDVWVLFSQQILLS